MPLFALQAHIPYVKSICRADISYTPHKYLYVCSVCTVQSVGCELQSNEKCQSNLTALCHACNVYDFRMKSSKTVNRVEEVAIVRKRDATTAP